MNPLEVALLLRRVMKQEWVIDARIVVEIDDERAWRDLLEVKEIADLARYARVTLTDPAEVLVDGVAFRFTKRRH